MAREKFLLVSLSESKTKELAQAITNETCRKILDYLAEKDATESELAEKLNIPISTVHYNLQQLQRGNLILSDEFHYSEKGREISHYKLANKYIIIAPKSTYGIKEKLKSILPVALIAAAGAGFIHLFSRGLKSFGAVSETRMFAAEKAVEEAAPLLAEKTAGIATGAGAPSAAQAVVTGASEAAQKLAENATFAAEKTPELIPAAQQIQPSEPNIALWFFIGAVAAILLYLLIDWLRNRKK